MNWQGLWVLFAVALPVFLVLWWVGTPAPPQGEQMMPIVRITPRLRTLVVIACKRCKKPHEPRVQRIERGA